MQVTLMCKGYVNSKYSRAFGKMDKCACCGETFTKKAKGYARTGIHSKFKGVRQSVAEVLQILYGVTVTPKKEIYLCDSCTAIITTISTKQEQVKETVSRFRKVKVPGTYISKKLPVTPLSSVKILKRQRIGTPKPSTPKAKTSAKKTKTKSVLQINNTRIGQAVQKIAKGKYLSGLKQLFTFSKSAKNAATSVFEEIVRREMKSFSKSTRESTNLDNILNFKWADTINIGREECPTLLSLVTASITTKGRKKSMTRKRGQKIVSVVPVVGGILSMIGFNISVKSCMFQQMNSLMMWLGGCKRKVFGGFNRLGMCMSIDSTRRNIDKYKQDYDSKVLQWKTAISPTALAVINDEEMWDDFFDDETMDQDTFIQVEPTGPEDSDSTQLHPLVSDDLATKSTTEETIPFIDENANVDPEGPSYYDITFDNVNQKIGVRHHFKGKENKTLNMVQAYACKDRISTTGLSNDIPSAESVRNIPITSFLVNDEEEIQLKEELITMVQRLLSTYMPCFQDLRQRVIWSIEHPHSAESARKSDIVPLGIESKDETKTAEVIELLDIYKKYVPEKADGSPMQLILYCDGLSCERVDGAQKARINGGDPWARLEMYESGIQEWHKRLLHMQDTYEELFKYESHREKGTLFNIKQVFDHRGVSKNIMECFNKAEELLEFATKAYVLLAAMEILKMNSIETELDGSVDERAGVLDSVSKRIIQQIYQKTNVQEIVNVTIDKTVKTGIYCICKLETGGEMIYCCNKSCNFGQWFHLDCIGIDESEIPEEDWFCSDICRNSGKQRSVKKALVVDKLRDMKKEYVERLMWRGLNDMVRHDAIKENDGLRMIRHWKADMPDLFENNHPKYFIFAHRLLCNISGAVSARMREQLIWNRTVNSSGGARNNIPKDLHCEHLNKMYKENCRDAGGQLTESTINRHSQMLGIGKALEKTYQEQVVESRVITRRHTRKDDQADVRKLVSMLQPLKLFKSNPGRHFKGFESLKMTKGVTHPRKFKERIARLTEKMALRRDIVMNR